MAIEPARGDAGAASGLAAPLPDVAVADTRGYVDWAAILAGAAVAAALAMVLLTFGAAIGLSSVSLEAGDGASLKWMSIASGIWFVWVALTSIAAGGYMAGRMRRPMELASEHEVETRDGAHGVLAWAVAALVGAVLTAGGIGSLAGATASATGTVAESASTAISGDLGYLADRMMRGSDGEGSGTGDAGAIMTRALSDGELGADDREYLVDMVAAQTGLSPEAASQRIDTAMTEAQAFYDDAIAAAEQARVVVAIAAFVVAATMVAGIAVAYFAATAGGTHRDAARPFRTLGQ